MMKSLLLKLLLLVIVVLISGSAWAQQSSYICTQTINTNGGTNCIPVSASNPFPISVFGGSNGQCFVSNGVKGVFTTCPGGGGSTPGGSTTQVQFNSAGSFAGTALATVVTGGLTVGSSSLATTSTTGFVYLPAVAGIPTGIATTTTGFVAATYDTTDNRLYIYNGGWSNVGTALSSLVGATGTNSFDNSNFAQVWSWGSVTTQTALQLTATNMTTGTVLTITSTAGATGPAFSVTGNTSLGGTTTVNNLNVTGTCTGCGGGGSLIGLTTTTNTALGVGAVSSSNTATQNNTGIGYKALSALVTGATEYTAVGYQALIASTSTLGHTSVGGVTAVGGNAGVANTTGFDNTFVGYNAGSSVTTASGNVIVGNAPGVSTANNNTILGDNACPSPSMSSGNTCVGQGAANSNYTGANSVFVGSSIAPALVGGSVTATIVGEGIKFGNGDTAFGFNALASTATNNLDSVAVGHQALTAVTTGPDNTAVGYQAGKLITIGSSNLVIGALAGTTSLASGNDNILIGGLSDTTTPGASHEFHLHDPSLAAGTDAVSITGMGANTTETATIHGVVALPDLVQSSAAQTGTMCWASGSITYDATLGCLTSTRENKEKIVSFAGGLAAVMKFKPVSFFYKDKKMDASEELGLLAEDVKEVEPRLVGYGSDGKLRGVRYEQLTAVLISAIQEQQKEIDVLKAQMAKHK